MTVDNFFAGLPKYRLTSLANSERILSEEVYFKNKKTTLSILFHFYMCIQLFCAKPLCINNIKLFIQHVILTGILTTKGRWFFDALPENIWNHFDYNFYWNITYNYQANSRKRSLHYKPWLSRHRWFFCDNTFFVHKREVVKFFI